LKIQLLVNPAAGGGKGERLFPHLLAQIKDLCPSANGFLSRNPQEALTVVQQVLREGCDCLVVGGGDGTVHSVLPALVNHPAALGVIPIGGANDLARNWNIPLDFREAVGVLRKGQPRAVDLIATDSGCYIAGAGGVGLDVAVIERAQVWRRRWKGILPFFLAVPLEFLRYRSPRVSIRAGDWQYSGPAWQVLFTKIPRYAMVIRIVSNVKMDDGLMGICVAPSTPKFRLLARLPLFPFLGFPSLPAVRIAKASSLTIESSPPLSFHGDGDIIGQTPVSLRVLPQALKVMMPAASPPPVEATPFRDTT
jgi:diacylglycerol kinase (ATP)